MTPRCANLRLFLRYFPKLFLRLSPISYRIDKMTKTQRVTLTNLLVNEGKQKIFFCAAIVIQIAYFAYSYHYYSTTKTLVTFRGILGQSLIFSRSAANLLYYNCGIILFTVCRNLISVLRTTILNRVRNNALRFNYLTADTYNLVIIPYQPTNDSAFLLTKTFHSTSLQRFL